MQEEKTEVYLKTGPAGSRPLYATAGSAGCDLFAAAELVLFPGQTKLLTLDLIIVLAPGVEAQIRPRSGLSLKTSLRLANAPGTIDSDYRQPLGLILHNSFSQADLPLLIWQNPDLAAELAQPDRQLTWAEFWQEKGGLPEQAGRGLGPQLAEQLVYLDSRANPYGTIYIKSGEGVAQMVFCRYLQAEFIHCEDAEKIGQDRGGGFGSTGI